MVEDRGHSIVVDDGWPAVAEQALAFLDRFCDASAARRAGYQRDSSASVRPAGTSWPWLAT